MWEREQTFPKSNTFFTLFLIILSCNDMHAVWWWWRMSRMLCQLHTAAVVTSVISSTPHPGLKPWDSSSSSTNVRRMFGRLSTFILPPPVLKLYLLLAIAKSGLQSCVQSSCYVRACLRVCVCAISCTSWSKKNPPPGPDVLPPFCVVWTANWIHTTPQLYLPRQPEHLGDSWTARRQDKNFLDDLAMNFLVYE